MASIAQTRAGKGRDAIKMLQSMAQSSPDAANDPRIDVTISESASALGDDTLRRDAAEQAAVKASQQGALLLVARARTQECRALANLGENDKTTAVCEEGRRILEQAGDRGGLARMLHSMAEVPLNQEDLVTAEKLYRQALSITQEIGLRAWENGIEALLAPSAANPAERNLAVFLDNQHPLWRVELTNFAAA